MVLGLITQLGNTVHLHMHNKVKILLQTFIANHNWLAWPHQGSGQARACMQLAVGLQQHAAPLLSICAGGLGNYVGGLIVGHGILPQVMQNCALAQQPGNMVPAGLQVAVLQ